MFKKQKLGQFFTKQYSYIFNDFQIPKYVKYIIEPFTGDGDLLKFIGSGYNVECYDIDPKHNYIKKQDTILNPPDYNNKYIITNPPFLSRNKCKDKTIYNKYKQNDLYKCFIKSIIINKCIGGILIVPINFMCSIRKLDIDIRQEFLKFYNINKINIFENQVFNETKYNICSFMFELRKNNIQNNIITTIYPEKKIIYINFKDNYLIGGELYKLPQNNNIIIQRLTKKNINKFHMTNMLVKCIDNINNKIEMIFTDNPEKYIDNTKLCSARTFVILGMNIKINNEVQNKIITNFNKYLNLKRKEYNSLFLTNYRENNRKRILFDLIYIIVNYLLNKNNLPIIKKKEKSLKYLLNKLNNNIKKIILSYVLKNNNVLIIDIILLKY
jgi:hypothetical protein